MFLRRFPPISVISNNGSRLLSSGSLARPMRTPSMLNTLYGRPFTSTPVKQSAMQGSYHWQFERLISFAILPACVLPLAVGPNGVCDFALTFLLPLHCHMGFDQVISDYLNPRKIGAAGNMAAKGVLLAATLATTYGLYQFNTNDVGITEFVKRLWHAGQEKNVSAEKH